MRFSVAALFFAGAAMAGTEVSTVYSTEYLTTTSCAPEVTNCPAKVNSKVYPFYNSTAAYVAPTGSAPVVVPVTTAGTAALTVTPAASSAACPTYSVKTISTSVTTVVPTVIYETVAVPCPTTPPTTASAPSASAPSGTGAYTVPPSSVVTAGAGNVAFSGVLAAAAGLLAVFLA